MNSQFVMISIVWIQIKINSLMAKVISISKSLGSFSMPDIILSAWHGLSDTFTPHDMPKGNCYYPHLTDGRNWG